MLKSKHIFYADDCKLYADPVNEKTLIDDDLKTVEKWCPDWFIPINPSKCSVLHLGHNNPKLLYTINKNIIKVIESQKDLGIVITTQLKWTNHVINIVKRANSMIYLFRKAFQSLNETTFTKLYKTYIRPLLEFGNVIWSPNLKKDINSLEKVQRRATKLVGKFKNTSYGERKRMLKISDLKQRRIRGDLIWTYKILPKMISTDLSTLFVLNRDTRNRGHSYKLLHQKYNKTCRQNFFVNRVFSSWNALTEEIVSATSVNIFKNKLDIYLENRNELSAQAQKSEQ
ncbi:hypothetical protein BDFB_009272 [Asbolus verrucosus]|uniref:RVT 1 domain containing protein n=1 Tax=Asbolus verrucosus TaxID=1661398 RepID=A0A482VWP3_ASBVE|nr:hypothetical protein BDFB_009272 [Asbolus verrucosus]